MVIQPSAFGLFKDPNFKQRNFPSFLKGIYMKFTSFIFSMLVCAAATAYDCPVSEETLVKQNPQLTIVKFTIVNQTTPEFNIEKSVIRDTVHIRLTTPVRFVPPPPPTIDNATVFVVVDSRQGDTRVVFNRYSEGNCGEFKPLNSKGHVEILNSL